MNFNMQSSHIQMQQMPQADQRHYQSEQQQNFSTLRKRDSSQLRSDRENPIAGSARDVSPNKKKKLVMKKG